MNKLLLTLLLLQLWFKLSNGLSKCSEDLAEPQFCKVTDKYPITPFIIHPTIDILDVIEINDDFKTITLYFQLLLAYNDTGSLLIENLIK